MGRKRKTLLDTILPTHIVTYIYFYLLFFASYYYLFIWWLSIYIYNQKRLYKHVCLLFEQIFVSDLRSACQLKG